MQLEPQTVESILSIDSPAIKVPQLLKTKVGRVMKPSYSDELLPHGFGFQFECELDKELFEQFRDNIAQVRAAMFALCNRYGVITGPLSSPLNIGMVFNRAQGETIWHVDRSEQADEYYTLLTPADSTVAKTWVSPVLHFLSTADFELDDLSSSETLETIRKNRKTTGKITDRISEIADSINMTLNTGTPEKRMSLAAKIEKQSVLIGGKHGWLLFSDPLVIHNGNQPTGEDKHIVTFDLACNHNGPFRSVYDATLDS